MEVYMLCVLESPIDLAMWVKLDNLIRNKRGTRRGVVVVEPLSMANFSYMIPGEKLTLVAHGGTATFGGMTPSDLAKTLIKKKLRDDIASIRLSGCHSGNKNNGAPVCLQLARFLHEKTKHKKTVLNIKVTGFVGTAVTGIDGHVRVKIKGKDPSKGPTYTDIITKYKESGEMDRWNLLAVNAACSTQDKIIENARKIAKASRSLFAELYLLNDQITLGGALSRLRVFAS